MKRTLVAQDDVGRKWLREIVATTLGVMVKRERAERDVFVISVRHSNAAHLRSTVSTGGSSSRSGPGSMQGINLLLGSLAGNLEGKLHTPVLDETSLTNHYDFELAWEVKEAGPPDARALAKAMREQLGLDLTPAKRPIEVLVVDKAH